MGSNTTPRTDLGHRHGVGRAVVIGAIVLVVVALGVVLLQVVGRGEVVKLDHSVAAGQNLDNRVDRDRVPVARAVTQLGSTVVLASIVVITVTVLAARRRGRAAMFVLVTTILGSLLNVVLKAIVGRSRPQFDDAVAHALGKSFPSGHAMNSAIVYGCIVVVAWGPLRTRWRRTAALVVASGLEVAIAASRVMLTVHYVSDVVAGGVLGIAFVAGSAFAFRVWHPGERPRADRPGRSSTVTSAERGVRRPGVGGEQPAGHEECDDPRDRER